MNLLDKHENIGTKLVDNTIVVTIPVETLYYAMNHRMFIPLKIKNKKEMVNYVLEWLTEWGGDGETGSTAFEDFLDSMFTDALESGYEWLDFMEEED